MAAVAEPAGDEPALAMVLAMTSHVSPAQSGARRTCRLKEWFCSLARVKPNWTMTQRTRFAKRALPSFFEHAHIDTPRKWFSQKISGTALGRPRSVKPAAVLALADIVSRVCNRVCCGSGVLNPSSSRSKHEFLKLVFLCLRFRDPTCASVCSLLHSQIFPSIFTRKMVPGTQPHFVQVPRRRA